jgi:hypothetical protein
MVVLSIRATPALTHLERRIPESAPRHHRAACRAHVSWVILRERIGWRAGPAQPGRL